MAPTRVPKKSIKPPLAKKPKGPKGKYPTLRIVDDEEVKNLFKDKDTPLESLQTPPVPAPVAPRPRKSRRLIQKANMTAEELEAVGEPSVVRPVIEVQSERNKNTEQKLPRAVAEELIQTLRERKLKKEREGEGEQDSREARRDRNSTQFGRRLGKGGLAWGWVGRCGEVCLGRM